MRRPRLGTFLGWTVLGLSSCTPAGTSLFVPTTWSDEELAVLLEVDAEGRPVADFSPTLISKDGLPLVWESEIDAPIRLLVLVYGSEHRADLQRCGVRYGGEQAPLPPPARVLASELLRAGDESAAFAESETVSWPAVSFADCSPDPCEVLESEAGTFTSNSDWTVATIIPIDDTTALTAVRNSQRDRFDLIRASELGSSEVVSSSTGTFDAVAIASDRVYVGDREGHLRELDRSTFAPLGSISVLPFTVLASRSDQRVVVFAPNEVFLAVAGGGRETLEISPLVDMIYAVFSEGGRLVAIADPGRLYEWDGQVWGLVETPLGERVEDARFDGEDLVVVTTATLLREREGQLESAWDDASSVFSLRSVAPFGDLELLAGTSGLVGSIIDGKLCRLGIGTESMSHLTVLSDRLAVAGNISASPNGAQALWIRRSR